VGGNGFAKKLSSEVAFKVGTEFGYQGDLDYLPKSNAGALQTIDQLSFKKTKSYLIFSLRVLPALNFTVFEAGI
jgi:hypothetical protein